MQKAFALVIGLVLSICVLGQNDSTITNKNLDEVIIYSNKFLENNYLKATTMAKRNYSVNQIYENNLITIDLLKISTYRK